MISPGEIEAIDEPTLSISRKRLNSGDGANSVVRSNLTGSGIGWVALLAPTRPCAAAFLVLHHRRNVTEFATKWFRGDPGRSQSTSARVLDQVAAETGDEDRFSKGEATLLDLGAERRTPTAWKAAAPRRRHRHGDAHIPWLICGGSAYSLRRQRPEGSGPAGAIEAAGSCTVRTRQLFIGRSGKGKQPAAPYFGLCGWRFQPAGPPDSRFDRWWAERRQHRWESPGNWSPSTF